MAGDRGSKSESIVAVVGLGKIVEAHIADLESTQPLQVDAVIAQAFHNDYGRLDWSRFRGLKVVFDGRGSIDPDQIHRAGADYVAVGVAGTAARRHA